MSQAGEIEEARGSDDSASSLPPLPPDAQHQTYSPRTRVCCFTSSSPSSSYLGSLRSRLSQRKKPPHSGRSIFGTTTASSAPTPGIMVPDSYEQPVISSNMPSTQSGVSPQSQIATDIAPESEIDLRLGRMEEARGSGYTISSLQLLQQQAGSRTSRVRHFGPSSRRSLLSLLPFSLIQTTRSSYSGRSRTTEDVSAASFAPTSPVPTVAPPGSAHVSHSPPPVEASPIIQVIAIPVVDTSAAARAFAEYGSVLTSMGLRGASYFWTKFDCNLRREDRLLYDKLALVGKYGFPLHYLKLDRIYEGKGSFSLINHNGYYLVHLQKGRCVIISSRELLVLNPSDTVERDDEEWEFIDELLELVRIHHLNAHQDFRNEDFYLHALRASIDSILDPLQSETLEFEGSTSLLLNSFKSKFKTENFSKFRKLKKEMGLIAIEVEKVKDEIQNSIFKAQSHSNRNIPLEMLLFIAFRKVNNTSNILKRLERMISDTEDLTIAYKEKIEMLRNRHNLITKAITGIVVNYILYKHDAYVYNELIAVGCGVGIWLILIAIFWKYSFFS